MGRKWSNLPFSYFFFLLLGIFATLHYYDNLSELKYQAELCVGPIFAANVGRQCHILTRPHTDHIPSTYWPHTVHILTTYRPHTDHIPSTYRAESLRQYVIRLSHIPSTYYRGTGHRLSTYRLHSMYSVCKEYLRSVRTVCEKSYNILVQYRFFFKCQTFQTRSYRSASYRFLIQLPLSRRCLKEIIIIFNSYFYVIF